MTGFNAIVLDPDEGARTRLKTATHSVKEFANVSGCADERSALRWLGRYEQVDLVFVAERLTFDQIKSFIDKVKEHSNCTSAVYVLLKTSAAGGIPPSEALLAGADGVLCEPFSVQGLMEVVALARRLGAEREQVKSKITVTLMVTDLLNQLDAMAYLTKHGNKPTALLKSMRALGAKIRTLPEEQSEIYFDVLERLSSVTKPMNESLATKIYKGASSRVRKNTEIKVWKEIANIKKEVPE